MKLVVISPEAERTDELAVLDELFAAGLERYHVRKPAWSRAELELWLREVSTKWRSRLVLHQHHELVAEFGLGGIHFRDSRITGQPHRDVLTSRSCHDVPTLRRALGHYDSVFIGPIFPSLSKPGYGPRDATTHVEISALLASRTIAERRTSVLALGGITPQRMPEVRALGFDGIAAIGAVWSAANPVRAFTKLQESLCCHAA
jgi:thiamine-phosphate pyrophosphorylase